MDTYLKKAIETGDTEEFDALAKDFASFPHEDKESLLADVVSCAPNTAFVQHTMDWCPDYRPNVHEGWTLLHHAAHNPNPEITKFFLEKGFDIESRNEQGNTPAHYAAGFNRNFEVVRLFLERGFDTESRGKDGFTLLMMAAFYQGNVEVIDMLVKEGADILAKDDAGNNLLHIAAGNIRDASDIVRYLLSKFKTSDSKMRKKVIFGACVNSNREILKTLINEGYEIDITNLNGVTPLMVAALYNPNPAFIAAVFDSHATWNAESKNGRNVLHYAAANNRNLIYEWLLGINEFYESTFGHPPLEDDEIKRLAAKKDANGHEPAYYREHKDEFWQ